MLPFYNECHALDFFHVHYTKKNLNKLRRKTDLQSNLNQLLYLISINFDLIYFFFLHSILLKQILNTIQLLIRINIFRLLFNIHITRNHSNVIGLNAFRCCKNSLTRPHICYGHGYLTNHMPSKETCKQNKQFSFFMK